MSKYVTIKVTKQVRQELNKIKANNGYRVISDVIAEMIIKRNDTNS